MSTPFDLNQLFGNLTQGLQEVRERAADIEAEGQAGGGMVTVTANGKMEILKVRLTPEAAEELDLLEDLITAAANEALRKAREALAEKMSALAGGLPLPTGLF